MICGSTLRNLEEAGCPPDARRHILTAELDRRFYDRRAALPVNTNFWITARERTLAREQTRQQERELERELKQVMRDLAGADWQRPDQRPSQDKTVELFAFTGEFLTDEKAAILGSMFQEYEAERYRNPSFGIAGPEDVAERKAKAEDFRRKLAAALTPAELEELRLRWHGMDLTDVWSVATQFGSDMTGAEVREVLRITRSDIDPLDRFLREEQERAPKSVARQEEEHSALRALLGEERFQAYLEAQYPEFKLLHRYITRELKLPNATAVAVHAVRRTAEEQAQALRRDPSLSFEQRQAALNALHAEVTQQLASAMDPDKLAAYTKDQGAWIEPLRKP
ncbi:MAG: hypothetical protein AB9869_13430 [Verrucomicrobiia bacterium]